MIESEITKKLSDISLTMADGFTFIKLRFMMESYEKCDDDSSKKLIEIVENFWKLLEYTKRN